MRLLPAFAAAAALTALLPGAASASTSPVHVATAHGTFTAYAPSAHAVTYRPGLVPAGARAHVFSLSAAHAGTTTTLVVTGLRPGRAYGAHAHAQPCGATGDAAGPHFQHVPDPVKPSTDPAYANPRNEIWLDFTTDRLGTGFARSTVDWTFDARRPRSVVVHETHTHTDLGHAGTAGARLACLDVDF
ncbi:Cu-Zn family superoxide dismutase [Amycolatopsis lexingtonensis]|uniref:Cu-Zn family superoxide dismutase n=1 Tax=Amycolatopsis lexingtonensis TaxID=218822 RepID=A0ABR9IA57_9PSEU|nr:superoxide dismutase family protein [Amycolatopsis lexingtonensis]MBE1500081.1 Cu-Zn family superoxide dismutase [Amycolatopsis lexingtonensis]